MSVRLLAAPRVVPVRRFTHAMVDMTEDDSAGRLDLWWQRLTEVQRTQFADLKAGDPYPREQLTPYSRASLVVVEQGQQGSAYRVNDRLGAFLATGRDEQ